jgi:hypothetical protein
MRKIAGLVFGLTLMIGGQAHGQTTNPGAPPARPGQLILLAPTAPPPLPPDPGPDVTVQQEPPTCSAARADPWPVPKGGTPNCPWGTATLDIRNVGLQVAHNVSIKIPYPKEADRDAHLLRSSVKTKCKREGKKKDSEVECEFGDLAPGGLITLQLAYSQTDGIPSWSAVQAAVATSDHENRTNNNTATLQPLEPKYLPIKIVCDKDCQKRECEEHQSHHGSTIASLTVMIKGPPCEKQPKWMRYVVTGVFAAGAIVTGVGAVAIAEFGAADTVVFNAGEAGGFIR